MDISAKFDHFNINVSNLEKSEAFYAEALGLKEIRRLETPEFTLAYLGDGKTPFLLELTYLKSRTAPCNLGDNESHLCLRVDGDYDAVREFHRKMGCICFENAEMGLYFIEDCDGYWIEILPKK